MDAKLIGGEFNAGYCREHPLSSYSPECDCSWCTRETELRRQDAAAAAVAESNTTLPFNQMTPEVDAAWRTLGGYQPQFMTEAEPTLPEGVKCIIPNSPGPCPNTCAKEGVCAAASTQFEAGSKPSNPKDLIGSDKLPLHLWPETATAMGCLAFLEGACKYGLGNFRVVGVRASIYLDALDRHLKAYAAGQDIDPDSGIPHLGKALACIAILVDAQAVGKLNDDRTVDSGFVSLCEQLTPLVGQIKARHADKSPKHYFHINQTETL